MADQKKDTTLSKLLDEKVEIDLKIEEYRQITRQEGFNQIEVREQSNIREQLYHMENYSWVLNRRIRSAKGIAQ